MRPAVFVGVDHWCCCDLHFLCWTAWMSTNICKHSPTHGKMLKINVAQKLSVLFLINLTLFISSQECQKHTYKSANVYSVWILLYLEQPCHFLTFLGWSSEQRSKSSGHWSESRRTSWRIWQQQLSVSHDTDAHMVDLRWLSSADPPSCLLSRLKDKRCPIRWPQVKTAVVSDLFSVE